MTYKLSYRNGHTCNLGTRKYTLFPCKRNEGELICPATTFWKSSESNGGFWCFILRFNHTNYSLQFNILQRSGLITTPVVTLVDPNRKLRKLRILQVWMIRDSASLSQYIASLSFRENRHGNTHFKHEIVCFHINSKSFFNTHHTETYFQVTFTAWFQSFKRFVTPRDLSTYSCFSFFAFSVSK